MGIENISSILKHNNTLKYLDLSFNHFDDTALAMISESLKTNNCLRYLNLLGNVFGDMGVMALTKALEYSKEEERNTTLMILKLGDLN